MLAPFLDAGESVVLAPFRQEDVTDAYVGWLNDPLVTRFTEIQPGANSIESVGAYIVQALASPTAVLWRVVVGSEHVGNIRLSDIRWRHYRAQVALLIGSRAHWGQGIATRAIGTVSAHALGPMGLNKLEAGILIGNVASRRAFEKSGYEVEGRLRAHAFFEGAFCDTLLMSRFRERPSGE